MGLLSVRLRHAARCICLLAATFGGALLVPVGAAQAVQSPIPRFRVSSLDAGVVPATPTKLAPSNVNDGYATVQLPFAFPFAGVTYPQGSTLWVSTNGNVQFSGNGAIDDHQNTCPTPSSKLGPAIMAYWDDLSVGAAGEGIFTGYDAATQRFSIRWVAERQSDGQQPGSTAFTLTLTPDGTYEVQYDATAGSGANSLGGSATLGAQASSTLALTSYNFCEAQYISPGTHHRQSIAYPQITGESRVDTPLTTVVDAVFAYPPSPTVVQQWLRCDAVGAGCAPIEGATNLSYVPVDADVGHALRVRATGTLNGISASLDSPATAVVKRPVPAAPEYTATASSGASIDPGEQDIGLHDYDGSTTIALPFPVSFYGQRVTQARVFPGGFLSLDPDGSDANYLVSVFKGELQTLAPGGVFTGVRGTAPHRSFVVEWRTAGADDPSSHANFEVVLYEDSPTITTIYGSSSEQGAHQFAGVTHSSTDLTRYSSPKAGSLPPGLRVDYRPSLPAIGGAANPSGGLTVAHATWHGHIAPALSTQWLRCDASGLSCTDVPGATGVSYAPVPADQGHAIAVRETATSIDGTASVQSDPTAVVGPVAVPPAGDRTAPVLSSLKAKPSTFRAARSGASIAATSKKKAKAKTGTSLGFTLSEAAKVTFTLTKGAPGRRAKAKCVAETKKDRRAKRCTRTITLPGTFSAKAKAGKGTLGFTGRLGKRTLARGSYRLVAVATDAAGNRSKARSIAIKVVR